MCHIPLIIEELSKYILNIIRLTRRFKISLNFASVLLGRYIIMLLLLSYKKFYFSDFNCSQKIKCYNVMITIAVLQQLFLNTFAKTKYSRRTGFFKYSSNLFYTHYHSVLETIYFVQIFIDWIDFREGWIHTFTKRMKFEIQIKFELGLPILFSGLGVVESIHSSTVILFFKKSTGFESSN